MTDSMDWDALARDLRGIGATEYGDFYISARVDPERMPSSELIGITEHDGGRLEVWYRDMGRRTILLDTTDPEEARTRMIEEVDRLCDGRYPGRGLRAQRP